MKRIRLFMVDGHPVVRKGVDGIFDYEADIKVVGSAASAQDALERVPGLRVDVLLADLRMEEKSGNELVAELHKPVRHPGCSAHQLSLGRRCFPRNASRCESVFAKERDHGGSYRGGSTCVRKGAMDPSTYCSATG